MDIDTENNQTVELDDAGVTVSSPDTDTQDVTSEKDEGPASMAEAVADFLKKEEGEPSDPGTENADETGDAGTAEPAKAADGSEQDADASSKDENPEGKLPDGDPTEEELKDYSQKANARIRDLVSQRNEARNVAQRVEPIFNFLEQNQIPQQDLDVVLDLTARLRHGDFAGFLQGVTPYVELAQQYTGQALPADLQQQVQQGYVSPEIAKELAQRRAQLQISQDNVQTAQRSMHMQQVEQRAGSIRTAIEGWEAQARKSDPDYALKAEMVRRTSQAIMQEHGVPQTPEDALKVVETAYEEVNRQAKAFRPQVKPTTRTPKSTGQQGGSAPVAEPTSMMEAAMQGLQSARG